MNDRDSIPIDEQPRYVNVGGTQLRVMRLRRCAINRCLAAATIKPGVVSDYLAVEYVVRAALANKDNERKEFTCAETGRPVKVLFANMDLVGVVVSPATFEAISNEDVKRIAALAEAADLTEEQRGNSCSPLAGSTSTANE